MKKNANRTNQLRLNQFLKVFVMFKCILFFIVLSTFQVFSKGYSQSKINISLHNITLKAAFKEIEKKSDYRFLYSDNVLDKNNLQTNLDANEATLDDAMAILLAKTNLEYKLSDNNQVILREKSSQVLSLKITGVVTDEKNIPLPGVSIKVKGTNVGTQTGIDGKYVLNIPNANAKDVLLIFSFIGYQTQEKEAGGSTTINITLRPTDKNLEEVVVVGYGSQKKGDLTGAINTVSGAQLNKRVVTDPLVLLQGQAPGLQIIQNSGEPGNTGASLKIRGQGSFTTGVDPLIVVDGLPLVGVGNLNQLNPNDIENISVLKDASAASIYGSRGANGVILVTTKKGSSTGKVNLDYSYNAGITTPTKLLNLIDNSVEYMQMYNQAAARQGIVTRYSNATIAQYSPGGIYAGTNVNWQDLIFSTVLVSNHYLSINGTTSSNTRYNVSLGYVDEPGTLISFFNKKYTFQLGLNTDVNKTITAGVNINMNYSNRQGAAQGSGDTYLSAITQPPLFGPYALDGSGNFTDTNNSDPAVNVNTGTSSPLFHNKNVFAVANSNELAINKTYNAILNTFIDVKVAKGLVWETRGGINFQYNRTSNFRPQVKTYNYYTGAYQNHDLDVGTVGLTINTNNNLYPTAYSQLTYNKTIGQHNFTLLGGGAYEYQYVDNLNGFRNGFLAYETNITQLNAGAASSATNGSSASENSKASAYARFNYNYANKYYFQANIRDDVSSKFAPGNRSAIFPSFSAGWRITQESFIKNLNLKALTDLKLRGSYGILGNENITQYPYQPLLSTGNGYPLDNSGNLVTNVTAPNLVDATIQWEKTRSTDIGFDASFLNGRLTASFDYYNKFSYDILRGAIISTYKGLGAPTINLGQLRNRGYEVSLGFNDNKGDFSYGATLGFELNRNIVLKYGTPNIPSTTGTTAIQEGHEYNNFYMYQWVGIFQTDAEAAASGQPFSPKAGDLKYADLNGDGKIDANDRTFVSGNNPNFDYSANFNFGYKNFDLFVALYGVDGQKNYGNNFGIEPFAQNEPPLKIWRNAWTPDNHSQTMPALYIAPYNAVSGVASTYFLHNASFLKIKNVQLGYNVPTQVSKKFGVTNLRVYVAADNLAVFTKYPELDPERTQITGGNQFDTYPQNRVFEIGVKVKF